MAAAWAGGARTVWLATTSVAATTAIASNLQRMGDFLSGRGVRRAERRLANQGGLVQFAWFCCLAWFWRLDSFCELEPRGRPRVPSAGPLAGPLQAGCSVCPRIQSM